MKILAIHRFFWPDTAPYASILRAIVCQWVKDGHDVVVLSSQPSYKAETRNIRQSSRENLDGAEVIRLDLPFEVGRPLVRFLNAIRLGVGILTQALFKMRYDVIMISTYPPVLGGLFAAIAAKLTGARFIYHCMDLHPEIGRISGEFRNPQIFQLLSLLDGWSCTRADPVVVLSDDMAKSLRLRNLAKPPIIRVLNNFSLPSDSLIPKQLPFAWPEEPFVMLFAGNIGRFQGLDFLIKAMDKLSAHKHIRLLMMGDGVEKERLLNLTKRTDANVTFVGHQSVEVAKASMARSSLGFVSLLPDLYKYAYPSKVMTYLEQGCPILVAVEHESCIARDIINGGAGRVVSRTNIEAICRTVLTMSEDKKLIAELKKNALRLSARINNRDLILAKWSSLASNKN